MWRRFVTETASDRSLSGPSPELIANQWFQIRFPAANEYGSNGQSDDKSASRSDEVDGGIDSFLKRKDLLTR